MNEQLPVGNSHSTSLESTEQTTPSEELKADALSMAQPISGHPNLPDGAHALASVGAATAAVINRLHSESSGLAYLDKCDQDELVQLAAALRENWTDDRAAQVVDEALRQGLSGRVVDFSALSRWILAHPNEPEKVRYCLDVDPPEDITILNLLSHSTGQKLVFLASWRLGQRNVVLKALLGTPEARRLVISREAQSHPLSIRHANIIETNFLQNQAGEMFFVEEHLPVVLNDSWVAKGIEEAANLLFDITRALTLLHDHLDLVHGDVKPANIGKRGTGFVLLDFGVCRPANVMASESTGTGSLRTRAPEVLVHRGYPNPAKADVWALGATVYKGLTGRYPLLTIGESVPAPAQEAERDRFEDKLRERVAREYHTLLDFSKIDAPLRPLLEAALTRDPEKRCTAAELYDRARTELRAFLRQPSEARRFSPLDEVKQLLRFRPKPEALKLMPVTERLALRERLELLRSAVTLNTEDALKLNTFIEQISE